jgi:transcriptional regulator with XRE-family HTH domain
MEKVNDKIRRLRKQKGLSQREVAQVAGIRQSSIASIEKGDTVNMSLESAVGIAKALEVNFNELFDIEADNLKAIVLKNEIETLKTRIKDLEEQLIEKKQIVELLVDAGLIITTANSIRNKQEEYSPVLRDFNDLDSLIKELKDQESFDQNALDYIQNYIKKLKGS